MAGREALIMFGSLDTFYPIEISHDPIRSTFRMRRSLANLGHEEDAKEGSSG